MNRDEAKFLLTAYRPGGQDAAARAFADALAQTQEDAELQGWFERSRAFDAQMAARLQAVEPPAGLREAILAGGRASFGGAARPPRRRVWLAWAAVLVIGAGVAGLVLQRVHRGESEAALARFALADVNHPGHLGDPDTPSRVALESGTGALDNGPLPIDFGRMERDGCRTLRLGGRPVLEVCFARGGIEYHLYIMRRTLRDVPGAASPPQQWEAPGASAAAWSTADYIVALATRGPAAALQRLL